MANTSSGTWVPFTTVQIFNPGQDPNQGDIHHSITSRLELRSLSFEELRVTHYAATDGIQRRYAKSASTTQNVPVALSVERPENGSRRYRGPVITFKVGNENSELFMIHESLVTGSSEFARLALQREWKEAADRIIPLPEDEPDIFEIYQAWLYDRSIYTEYWLGSEESADEAVRLLKAWGLGDKLLDTQFKDAIMDALIGRMNDIASYCASGTLSGYRRLIAVVYNKTPDDSAPRRLMIVSNAVTTAILNLLLI